MIGTAFKIQAEISRVLRAVGKAAFRNFGHAAARISKDAKASIEKADGPSPAGSPPHTHKRNFLKRAIRYDANKNGAVIGPLASVVGTAGQAHEFGGEYRDQQFPERPFMQPALERNLDRFAADWAGSVGP